MKPTVGPNTDMELDDEEFLKLTSPIVPGPSEYTEEEDAEMWKYVIENHRKYRKGSEDFWKDLALRMENARSPKSLAMRFDKIRASQLYTIDMDIEVKLELYKRCKIPVPPKYLNTLKEHYNLEFDKNRCVVRYQKIDDDGKPRTSNEKKKEQQKSLISVVKIEDIGEPVAKRQRYEKEFYIDSESDLDVTDSESRFGDFEDVLPVDEPQGSTSQRRDRETRSMARNKNIEQKAVFSKKTEEKSMKASKNSEKSRSSDDPVSPQNQLNANGSIAQLQELENRIVDKLANVVDAKITKLSKNLEESLQTEISKVSKSVATLTEEVRDVSRKILPDGEKESRKKKEFLLNLQNLISPLHAPELEDVVQRIDEAVQNSPEEDVDSNQMKMIRSSLDILLLAIGH